jgi:hypothetical protein
MPPQARDQPASSQPVLAQNLVIALVGPEPRGDQGVLVALPDGGDGPDEVVLILALPGGDAGVHERVAEREEQPDGSIPDDAISFAPVLRLNGSRGGARAPGAAILD